MQKKWWTKTRTILCSGLVITMLSATGALAVVACGEKNEDIPKVLHNRPVRGFYFRYEEKDYPRMKEVIRHVYDNNLVKKMYLKEGYSWPEITKITDPEIITYPYKDSIIPEDVFNQDYEESLDHYQQYSRILNFSIEFKKTDSNLLAPQKLLYSFLIDYMHMIQLNMNELRVKHECQNKDLLKVINDLTLPFLIMKVLIMEKKGDEMHQIK